MKILSIRPLAIPEIKAVRFARHSDLRGYFTETFRRSDLRRQPEIDDLHGAEFVQGNESYSCAGVIRGLHFQWNPFMGKLVRTVAGHMIDLVLDLRRESPWRGKVIAHDMPGRFEDDFSEWIWVPPGFAHGNVFLQPTCIEYLCTGEYSPDCEAGISPLAGDLDWSLCDASLKAAFDRVAAGSPTVSDKDLRGLSMEEWKRDPRSSNFVYDAEAGCVGVCHPALRMAA